MNLSLDSSTTTTPTTPAAIDPATAAILRGVARHGLTTVAGYLVAHGYLADSDTQQFVGAGLVLAGLAWSVLDKLARAELQRLVELAAASQKSPAPTAALSSTSNIPSRDCGTTSNAQHPTPNENQIP